MICSQQLMTNTPMRTTSASSSSLLLTCAQSTAPVRPLLHERHPNTHRRGTTALALACTGVPEQRGSHAEPVLARPRSANTKGKDTDSTPCLSTCQGLPAPTEPVGRTALSQHTCECSQQQVCGSSLKPGNSTHSHQSSTKASRNVGQTQHVP